jgi:hypothetical protein
MPIRGPDCSPFDMQGFPQSVAGIEIEDCLNLGRRFIGKLRDTIEADRDAS